ncbi:hypothetical protein TNCV_2036461 [Trichonephila clavipes]|nr:hypothetical protein TNCV_2036461 [Trichonephila clavipes]
MNKENVLVAWCGILETGVPAQMSTSSFDGGSELRGPSPKALVLLLSTTLISSHSQLKVILNFVAFLCERDRRGKKNHCIKINLCDVFGKEAVTARTCQKWLVKLRLGDFSLKDEPRSGRPQMSMTKCYAVGSE